MSIDVDPLDKHGCGCTWTLSAGCLRLLTRCIGHGWAAQRALGSPGVGDHAIEHTQHTDWQIELDPCPVHVKNEGPVARVTIETRPSTVHADYDYGEWVDLSRTDLPLAQPGAKWQALYGGGNADHALVAVVGHVSGKLQESTVQLDTHGPGAAGRVVHRVKPGERPVPATALVLVERVLAPGNEGVCRARHGPALDECVRHPLRRCLMLRLTATPI